MDEETVQEVDLTAAPSSRFERLQAKLVQSEAARVAAEGALTVEDRKEIELRRAIATAEERRAQAEIEKRDLDLERRLERAIENSAPTAKLTSLPIDHHPDTFILRHSSSAYARWETEVGASMHNKKMDKAKVSRDYAVAVVIDWNGHDLSDSIRAEKGGELVEFLKNNPAIVTKIVNEAATLAGAFSEARKS